MNNKQRKKFAVDAMLGNLAKKLRLFGYDTLYFSEINDNELLDVIYHDNRILVTEDNQLSKRAIKKNLKTIFLNGEDEIKQFIQIKQYIQADTFLIDTNKTRCTICNGVLLTHRVVKHE